MRGTVIRGAVLANVVSRSSSVRSVPGSGALPALGDLAIASTGEARGVRRESASRTKLFVMMVEKEDRSFCERDRRLPVVRCITIWGPACPSGVCISNILRFARPGFGPSRHAVY